MRKQCLSTVVVPEGDTLYSLFEESAMLDPSELEGDQIRQPGPLT